MMSSLKIFYVTFELLNFQKSEVVHLEVVSLKIVNLLSHERQVRLQARHLENELQNELLI